MLLLLPKDIVQLIDTILHRHRIDTVLREYRTLVRDHGGKEGAIIYRGIGYNYRSCGEEMKGYTLGLYNIRGYEVALLPKNY